MSRRHSSLCEYGPADPATGQGLFCRTHGSDQCRHVDAYGTAATWLRLVEDLGGSVPHGEANERMALERATRELIAALLPMAGASAFRCVRGLRSLLRTLVGDASDIEDLPRGPDVEVPLHTIEAARLAVVELRCVATRRATTRTATPAMRADAEHAPGLPIGDALPGHASRSSRSADSEHRVQRGVPAPPSEGRGLTWKEAAKEIGYPTVERPSAGALKMAVHRARSGDPLALLRGPQAKTSRNRLREELVAQVAGAWRASGDRALAEYEAARDKVARDRIPVAEMISSAPRSPPRLGAVARRADSSHVNP